ncbi:hypothetical protein GCM10025771_30990 [Niveibacterium umoris]
MTVGRQAIGRSRRGFSRRWVKKSHSRRDLCRRPDAARSLKCAHRRATATKWRQDKSQKREHIMNTTSIQHFAAPRALEVVRFEDNGDMPAGKRPCVRFAR